MSHDHTPATHQSHSQLPPSTAPQTKNGQHPLSEPERFQCALQSVRAIKAEAVDPRIRFYKDHTAAPRFWFRAVGITTILLSATLPALAAGTFSNKTLIVSSISVLVAVLTGIASFFHWENTWHGNSTTQVAIEQHCAKWALELMNAELSLPPEERIKHVYLATDDLLANVRNVMSSETEAFFTKLKFPELDRTSKGQ